MQSMQSSQNPSGCSASWWCVSMHAWGKFNFCCLFFFFYKFMNIMQFDVCCKKCYFVFLIFSSFIYIYIWIYMFESPWKKNYPKSYLLVQLAALCLCEVITKHKKSVSGCLSEFWCPLLENYLNNNKKLDKRLHYLYLIVSLFFFSVFQYVFADFFSFFNVIY